jgi:hypothetical protein
MCLPEPELTHLRDRGGVFDVSTESNMTCVLLRDYALPKGYDRSLSDLLLRLNPGFPDVPPDMWWFDPPVKRADGSAIPQTDSTEHYLGRSWQRWSRHLQAGQWRPGVDTLQSFLAVIRADLEKYAAA